MNAYAEDRAALSKIIDGYDVWRDQSQQGYARRKSDVKGEVLIPVDSLDLIAALQREFTEREQRSISRQAIMDAVASLREKAAGAEAKPVARVAAAIAAVDGKKGLGSLVLRTSTNKALWITRAEWNVVEREVLDRERQLAFLRQPTRNGMKIADIAEAHRKKPTPVSADPLQDIWTILTEEFPGLNSEGRLLVTAWLLGVLHKIEMPILVLTGPRGCGKTFLADALASLFARAKRYNLPLPRLVKDLHKTLVDETVVIFDNVRGISEQVSDELCRLITGGHLPYRSSDFAAYAHLNASRMIVTAIANPIEAEDLASRALVVEMAPASRSFDKRRKPEIVSAIAIKLLDALHLPMDKVALDGPLQRLKDVSNKAYVDYRFELFMDHVLHVERSIRGTDLMAQAIIKNSANADDAAAADEPLVILLESYLPGLPKPFTGTANTLINALREFDENGRWSTQPFMRSPRSMSVTLQHLRHTLKVREIEYSKLSAREHSLRWVGPPARDAIPPGSAVVTTTPSSK